MEAHASDPRMEELLAHAGWIRQLALSLVKDAAAADDLVQETWLAALRHPPRGDRPLRPWLAQVLRNFARMRARSDSNRARREETIAGAQRELPTPDELVERVETQRVLAAAVLALDEPFRTTVLLRYYEGLSAAEIARRVGRPSATVRWRLMRGMEELRRRLDERHRGDRRAWCLLLVPLASHKPALAGGLFGAAQVVALSALALVALWAGSVAWRRQAPARLDGAEGNLALAEGTDDDSRASPGGAPALAGVDEGNARRAAVVAPSAAETASVAREGPLARGRVVDPSGGPLAGAGAHWRAETFEAEARSGDDGRFELAVPTLDAPRLGALELSAAGRATRVLRVALAPGRASELGEIALEPGGSLAGSVSGPTSAPAAGAIVRLELAASRWASFASQPLEEARVHGSLLPEDAPRAVAGPDGRFTFDGLAVGFYRVWATSEGLCTAYSEPVAVRAGATSACEPLALEAPAPEQQIRGVVLDPSGDHVGGARIECARRSTRSLFFQGEPWALSTRAAPDGTFALYVGSFRNYDLAARDPEQRFAPVVLHGLQAGGAALEVRLGAPREIALRARAPKGESLADARVELVSAEKGELLRTARVEPRSADAWTVRAPHVPFRVRVLARGCEPCELGPFEPAAAPSELEARLVRAASVRGRITANGAPLEGARVELLPCLAKGWTLSAERAAPGAARALAGPALASRVRASNGHVECATDAAGEFALELVEDGSYLVRAEANGFAPIVRGPLELSRQRATAPLELTADAGGALEGRALRAGETPVAGCVVGVSCGDDYVRTARSAADGSFRFEQLPAGRWQVLELGGELSAGGWARVSGAASSGPIGEPAWSATVARGETAHCDLDLARAELGSLLGRLAFDGEAPGPWVVALRSLDERAGEPLFSSLDPDGAFRFDALRPGRWELRAWSTGYKASMTTLVRDALEVRAGETRWERDFACAPLTVENLPASPGGNATLYVLWQEKPELFCATRLDPAKGPQALVPKVPAGSVRIVRVNGVPPASPLDEPDPRAGKALLQLELRAGVAKSVRLP